MFTKTIQKIVVLGLIGTSVILQSAHAHGGRVNAEGCHGGSVPYHCHKSKQVSTETSSVETKKPTTNIQSALDKDKQVVSQ